MKAVWITRKGGPEVLELRDTLAPVPAAGEVLIRVKAAGLNRSDIYSRNSKAYGHDEPEIPGLEVSGTIETCGAGVTRWKPGDEVCALVTGGGYAEYVTVPGGQCLPIPGGWSLEAAASLPETVHTVWHNVFRTAQLQKGENFLVHGGSSGIGTTAIQLAKALEIPVYTTAGTDEKCRWCESLGATCAANYKTEDFEAVFRNIGFDVILDMAGGDFTPKNLRLLREDGRLVHINAIRGTNVTIDLARIMSRRLIITGSMLKPRDPAFKAALAADVEKQVWPLIARGAIRPLIYAVFPLAEAAEAQALMESGTHYGKIILQTS
ncbi:MAG TPA: NAD(P)H-quinone oxidoreductase [Puia sp.]|nr:NAD(P)H-quinone oxidoreductase [Puia sp.]